MPVIAVLRARQASQYPPVIDALVAGGIRSIELTLSTAGVIAQLPELLARFGPEVEIGVGTITDIGQAVECLEAGARFLVTPTVNEPVVRAACERGIPVFPGGLTPSELLAGWQAGATAVKVFPAATVGPDYLRQLSGPFPAMRVVPSGGIGMSEALDWIDAGALAVSMGGPLLGDAFSGGSSSELTERARQLTGRLADKVGARMPGASQ